MSFRSRTMIVVAATTIVTVGAAFAGVAVAFQRSLDDGFDVALRAQAKEEAAEAAELGGERLALPESSGFYANDVEPLARFAVLYGAGGEVLAKTAAFPCEPPPRASLDHPAGAPFPLRCGAPRLRAMLWPIPRHPGSMLLIAGPRALLQADATFLRRAMLVAFALAALWALLAARIVSRPIARDQEAIGAVLRRVAAGDLGARVGATSRDRETLRLAADVDETVARLSALVDAQRRFIANAAHELRSPLTTLLGELQLALRRPRDVAGYEAAIGEAIESTRQLARLSEDLLALARVGSTSAGESADISLLEVANAAVASVAPAGDEARVRLRVRGAAVVVHARPIELQRLIRNLVENAVAHSPEGGEVRVDVELEAELAVVSVEDDGEGVAPDEADRIFEPFHRGAKARSRGAGAGLGLSIARDIARAHGGDLVYAPRGAGARFVATLARRPAFSDTEGARGS